MFSKILFFDLSFITLLVAAGHGTTTTTVHPPNPSPSDVSSCNQAGFAPYCCNSVQSDSSPVQQALLALLGIVITPQTELSALGCSLLSGNCDGTVVCCEATQCGLVNVGCVNIVV